MNIKRIPVTAAKKLFEKIKWRRERKRWYKKIEGIYKVIASRYEHIPLDYEGYKKKWRTLSKKVNPRWYETYSYTSGKADLDYVAEDIYYMIIEPKLNRLELYRAYRDKNFYARCNPGYRGFFPDVLLRNMDGVFYDKNYQRLENAAAHLESFRPACERLVVKPSLNTGGGKDVRFFTRQKDGYVNKRGDILSPDYLRKTYRSNFLIQDYIEQHVFFKAFNPASMNTIRITTYRSVKDETVKILHANLRMGGKDSPVDNVGAGGAAVHVKDDGSLNDYASDKYGCRVYSPPAAPELKFAEMGSVPHYEEIKKTVQAIAADYHYFRILGFDVGMDIHGNMRIIEINFGGLGTIFQMDSGSLFKEYTDEVIAYCARMPHPGLPGSQWRL